MTTETITDRRELNLDPDWKHLYDQLSYVRGYLGDLSASLKEQAVFSNADPILQSLAQTVTKKTRAVNIMFGALKGQKLSEIETPPKDEQQRVQYYRHLTNVFKEHIFYDYQNQSNLQEMFMEVVKGSVEQK